MLHPFRGILGALLVGVTLGSPMIAWAESDCENREVIERVKGMLVCEDDNCTDLFAVEGGYAELAKLNDEQLGAQVRKKTRQMIAVDHLPDDVSEKIENVLVDTAMRTRHLSDAIQTA